MRKATKQRIFLWFLTAFSLFIVLGIFSLGNQLITGPAAVNYDPPLQRLEKLKAQLKEKNYIGSEKMAREILADVEAVYGENSLEAARVLDVLADSILGSYAYIYRKEYSEKRRQAKSKEEQNALRQDIRQKNKQVREESLALAERSLSIKEQILGLPNPEISKSWNDFVIQYGASEELLESALKMSEEAFPPNHPEIARILYQFGRKYFYGGEIEKAREPLERALRINESAFGPEHPRVAQVLDEYTRVLAEAGQFSEARLLQERAIRIREKDPDLEYGDYMWSVEVLRTIFLKMGAYNEIITLLERTLPFKEKMLGPDHPNFLRDMSMLASEYMDIGDYSKARTIYERVVATKEKIYGTEDESVLTTLNSLAVTYYLSGDYERARMLYERILTHSDAFLVLGNLALLYRTIGDYTQERAYLTRLVEVYEKYWGPELPDDPVFNLQHYAGALRSLGNLDKALEVQQHVLSIHEKNKRQDFQMVDCLFKLAVLYRDIGEGSKALALIRRALALQEKWEGPDHPNTGRLLHEVASYSLSENQITEALDEALRSEDIVREHFRLMASALSERGALAYANTKPNSLDICLSLAANHSKEIEKIADKAWDALIRSRALVFDEMSARHRTTVETSDPEIAALADSFYSARRGLANLVVRGPGPNTPIEEYRGLLEKASNRKEQAERALAEASINFREEIEGKGAGLAQIKASLPPGFALVAFARYLHFEPPSKERGQGEEKSVQVYEFNQVPSYLAFVLQAQNEEPTIVPLGKAEDIEPLVFDWGQEAARGTRIPGRSAKESEAAYFAAGDALRQRVWDPLTSHLGEANGVIVVPDGLLHSVNFAALSLGSGKYLIEDGPLIHYLSAERDLLSSEERKIEGTGLLALGNPAFDDTTLFAAFSPESKPKQGILAKAKSLLPFRGMRSGCGDFKSLEFTSLPASHQEIDEIADIWKEGEGHTREVLMLTGDMADEKAFKMAVPGRKILHLATHGFFLESDCPSVLADSEKRKDSGWNWKGELLPVTGENPLLLSGMALAGANHREAAGPEEEDGILTAEEVAALDLSGIDWVVLSACDTGVGKINAGEGIFGLRRAFRIAGAQTLITSLWAVEDEATRRWMRALYKARFSEGLGTAESVRKAYLDVLQELRKKKDSTHPFYWAGFVASGDWR
jgi:CHAT domain-containing protein/tetratricopeptide (TPR) repeat protein